MASKENDWVPVPADPVVREYLTYLSEARQKVVLAKAKSRPSHRLVRTFVDIAFLALQAATELQMGADFNGLATLKRIKEHCENRIAG